MILLFNTATDPVGMALMSGATLTHAKLCPSTHEFTEHLTEHLDQFCQTAGKSFKDLTGLCFTVGPGNYTGTRLGVTVGKTLAQTLEIPLYTLTTLEAYAWTQWPHEGVIVSVLSTRPPALRIGLFSLSATLGVARLTPDFDADQDGLARLIKKFQAPVTLTGPAYCPDIFQGLVRYMQFVSQRQLPPQPLDVVMPDYAYPPAIGGKRV